MTDTPPRGRRTPLLAVLAVMALAAAFRVRVADVPLERDEGEYAYAGQLILQGVPPYAQAYSMKFPGVYYAYSAIMALAGPSVRAIHLGLMLVNAATILLVFALGRRLLDDFTAVLAAAFFALLSLDRGVMGIWAHATHFALCFAMGGLLLLVRGQPNRRAPTFLGAGLLFGTAVLMKQHAVAYFAGGLALTVGDCLGGGRRDYRAAGRRAGWLGLGFALPLAALTAVMAVQGVWRQFWFWTVTYATEYVRTVPLRDVAGTLFYGVSKAGEHTFLIWFLAGAGLVALALSRWPGRARAIVFGLTAVSWLAIVPGFLFREHYFVLLLPALALLAAIAVAASGRLLPRARADAVAARLVASLLFLASIGHYVVSERGYLFTMSPVELSRQRYKGNLFPEMEAIGRYIREHSDAADRVAVLGSEPEIPFYAGRRSATGYVYTYALMEPQPFAQSMQEQMMREIESAMPLFLVTVKTHPSWLARPESDRTIFEWARRFAREHYEQVGTVEGDETGRARVSWSGAAGEAGPRAEILARVYRRREGIPR